MSTGYPYQATPLNLFLDSIATVLGFTTGFAPNLIVEWYGDTQVRYPGEQFISYRISEFINSEQCGAYPGAGRLSELIDIILDVRIYTKLASDVAGVDYQWFRNVRLGAYQQILNVWWGLNGEKIFTAYQQQLDGSWVPSPGSMELIHVPLLQVDSKLNDKDKEDPTWGIDWLKFRTTIAKPIGQVLG